MTLEVYSRYYNPDSRKTVVAIHDSDQAVFVRFDAVLDGNQIDLPEAELLDRAMDWFTNRYIQTYANQKLGDQVRKFEALIAELERESKAKVDKAVAELTQLIISLLGASDEEEEELDDVEEAESEETADDKESV